MVDKDPKPKPCPGCDGNGVGGKLETARSSRTGAGSRARHAREQALLGYVGGDNERAEDHDEPHRSTRPVWEEPAVRTLTVCHVCFGTRKVVNLGGTGEPTGKLVEMPCPACSEQIDEPTDEPA